MSSHARTTRRLVRPTARDFAEDAACVFASSDSEERARAPFWDDRKARYADTCVEVKTQLRDTLQVSLPHGEEHISLRDPVALEKLFLGRSCAYLDVSGLAHHAWAPLLRVGLGVLKTLWVVYAEPKQYRPHPSPASASLFDLTTSIGGVAPLPGFANLRGPSDANRAIFVALLGFEGTRARQVASTLDPTPPVYPVVGLPGFRIEYPHVTVACNQEFLEEHQAHGNTRFARASCPFEVYSRLKQIWQDADEPYMYIAPVGTKPHAIGALWFAIDHPTVTEIMYDHPERRPQRTFGVGTIHLYCLKDT